MFSLPSCLLLLATATLGNVVNVPAKRWASDADNQVVFDVSQSPRATVCNGHAELCSMSYGNVTFAGAHDAYAWSADPFALGANQQVDIPHQLASGIRLLQAQAHMDDGVLHLCHTSCPLFDGGTVASFLDTVMTFLNANPNEVLTLLFTNPEGVAVDTVWDPIIRQSGIANLAYVPPSLPVKQSDWPTLGELIDSGKRVVIFMDYNSNTSLVPYILPEFEMIWETPYDSTNATFPCSIDRIGGGGLVLSDYMNLLNHYLDIDILGILIPNKAAAGTTNGVKSIMANANGCAPLNSGRNPNFIIFDWVDIGSIPQALKQLNRLT